MDGYFCGDALGPRLTNDLDDLAGRLLIMGRMIENFGNDYLAVLRRTSLAFCHQDAV